MNAGAKETNEKRPKKKTRLKRHTNDMIQVLELVVTGQEQVKRRPLCAKETYEKRPTNKTCENRHINEMTQVLELATHKVGTYQSGGLLVRKKLIKRDLQKKPVRTDI